MTLIEKNDFSPIYRFDSLNIDKYIEITSPGVYLLGRYNDKIFLIKYVGRADENLNKRIKNHLDKIEYTHFSFVYASSPKDAFEKECISYHKNGENELLDNKIHPD